MIIGWLDQIIGDLPEITSNYNYNYEIVRYVIAGVVLIFMLSLVYRMIYTIFFGFARR